MASTQLVRKLLTRRSRSRILLATLVLSHIAAVPALLFVIAVGRPRYFAFFVVIVLGIIVLDVLLWASGREIAGSFERTAAVEILLDHRISILILATGVVVFVRFGLNLTLFLVMAIYFLMILVRVISADEVGVPHMDLFLIMAGSFLLIVAQLTVVPYFVRTGDTIYHTALALRIARTGFIRTASPGRYGNLPVFHTLMAAMTIVADQPSRLYIGITLGVLYQLAVAAIYLVLRKFQESKQVSLIGALLMAISPPFLQWGTQNHAQSLSFVFLVIFLLLLTTHFKDRRNSILTVFVITTWVLTHQLSLLMSISLLAIPVGGLYLYATMRRTTYDKVIKAVWLRFSILVLMLITYWTIVTKIMREPIAWLLYTSPSAQGVTTRGFIVQHYSNLFQLVQASLPEIIDKSHYIIWLGFASFGVWTVVRTIDRSDLRPAVALLAFLPAAVFLLPNPVWVVLQGTALLNRWGLMTLPFVILIPSIAIRRLLIGHTQQVRTGVALFAIGLLIFLSIGSGMTTTNVTQLAGYEKRVPKYLSVTDFSAMNYVFHYTNNTPTYGTSAVPVYLRYYYWRYRHEPGETIWAYANLTTGELNILPGVTVVQEYQLQQSKARVIVSSEPLILSPVSGDMVSVNQTNGSRVYDTNDTRIYWSR